MYLHNRLRQQVVSEIKKRKLIVSTVILLGLIYLSICFIFGDSSFLQYLTLMKKKTSIERQIAETQKENEQLRAEIKLIKEEPFYSEKYVREEYNLTASGDWVFIFDQK